VGCGELAGDEVLGLGVPGGSPEFRGGRPRGRSRVAAAGGPAGGGGVGVRRMPRTEEEDGWGGVGCGPLCERVCGASLQIHRRRHTGRPKLVLLTLFVSVI
jgi:hypothetical protein